MDYGFLKEKRILVVQWWRNHLKNLRSVAQSGRALDLGSKGREFESRHSDTYRGLMQWLASKAHNLEVPGSSPGPATNKR